MSPSKSFHILRRFSPWALSIALMSVFLLTLSSSPALGDVTARIQGTITDSSGAVIPGVKVTVTNVATGVTKVISSASDGNFAALSLPAPAVYNVTAQKTGFKKFAATAISLSVNQVYVLNIKMEVGAVTQEVTVKAVPAQVQKVSIELGATITGSQAVNLPLNGRNWIQLQQTLPGVVAAADGRGNYATNGSQPGQNSYMLNGIDENDLPLNTNLIQISPDAIGEVRMITNTINPEYGRNSGAIMNAVTKSGTNQFHGDGFEFYRDTSLNARNFFLPKPDVFHQNQFGGTIGGPIKKDHAFFFFSYQGTRNRTPQGGGTTTVFTQAQRNGSFPDIATSTTLSPFPMVGEDGTTYPKKTPYSTLFPTGNIPSSDFNPIAVSLMNKFVPLPNFSGTKYSFNPITAGVDDQYFTRIDENITSKDLLWGSWLWERHPTTDTLPFTGANLPGFPDTNQRHIQNYMLNWEHTFNGTTLNEADFGYTRFNYVAAMPVNVLDPSSVGFTGIKPQNPSAASYPVISLKGFFTLGFSNNGPQPRIDQTYQVDDNFTKIAGRHTFKMGFDMRRFQVYNPFSHQLSGNYGCGGSGTYSTGDAGADFLLGIPDTFSQGGGDVINARGQEYYMYFQDQYKLRNNLVITYGTGWQIDTPTVDNFHDNHAMTAFRPGKQSTVFPNAPVSYLFQGDAGIHGTGTTKYNHFGPRFGFAWSPGSSGRWSVRGGYGIYFNRELEEQELQYVNQAPFAPSSSGAASCGGSPGFADPYADIAGAGSCTNPFPAPLSPPSSVDFSPYLPTWLYAVDPNSTVPYSQNFNFTVERQLTNTSVLSVGYVGALGRKEVILVDANPGVRPAACLAGVGNEAGCAANAIYQDYFYPQNYNYGYDPRYGVSIFGIGNNQTTGVSNYNALQVTFNKHFSHGLSFQANYAWSHSLDNGSGFENTGFGGGGFGGYGDIRATNPLIPSMNYGSSEFSATHRFVVAYTYRIPAIHHFTNGAARRIFDGWWMSGITTFQTGFPLDVVDTSFRSLTCSALSWTACWDVPNQVAAPQYLDPRTSSIGGNDHYWFNTSAFVEAPIGVQGNAGRNPLHGPGIANFDWALMKDIQVTESTRMELRFEFYNLFNHTQFDASGITTDISSPEFGQILAARDPRLIQLAAKFYF
ncbi:MAG: carboxypeptidase regulatory-like domain-containing protein [Acidobacteriota bacterium]